MTYLTTLLFLFGVAIAGPVDEANSVVSFAGSMVNAISFLCAIFFLLSAIYNYSLYRKDPLGVRLSTPVVMILCAIVLAIFPYMSTAS